jgi:antitoxin (DNA-binding transcriptional repressor) of toxin-antitoxin stability system
MDSVTLQDARERLEELAARVAAGERVVVTKDGKPVFEMTAPEPPRRGGFDQEALDRFKAERGIDRIFTWIAPDFDDPLPEDFLLRPLPEPSSVGK